MYCNYFENCRFEFVKIWSKVGLCFNNGVLGGMYGEKWSKVNFFKMFFENLVKLFENFVKNLFIKMKI